MIKRVDLKNFLDNKFLQIKSKPIDYSIGMDKIIEQIQKQCLEYTQKWETKLSQAQADYMNAQIKKRVQNSLERMEKNIQKKDEDEHESIVNTQQAVEESRQVEDDGINLPQQVDEQYKQDDNIQKITSNYAQLYQKRYFERIEQQILKIREENQRQIQRCIEIQKRGNQAIEFLQLLKQTFKHSLQPSDYELVSKPFKTSYIQWIEEAKQRKNKINEVNEEKIKKLQQSKEQLKKGIYKVGALKISYKVSIEDLLNESKKTSNYEQLQQVQKLLDKAHQILQNYEKDQKKISKAEFEDNQAQICMSKKTFKQLQQLISNCQKIISTTQTNMKILIKQKMSKLDKIQNAFDRQKQSKNGSTIIELNHVAQQIKRYFSNKNIKKEGTQGIKGDQEKQEIKHQINHRFLQPDDNVQLDEDNDSIDSIKGFLSK